MIYTLYAPTTMCEVILYLYTPCPVLIIGFLIFQMSGRGFEYGQQWGRIGHGRRSSFFGDWLTGEATADPSLSEHSSEGEVNSDDDLIREVKGYTEAGEMERDTQPQTTRGNLPQATHLACNQWCRCFDQRCTSLHWWLSLHLLGLGVVNHREEVKTHRSPV